MTCYAPLLGYKVTDRDGNVKVKILHSVSSQFDLDFHRLTFTQYVQRFVKQRISDHVEPILVSCGQCEGCRLRRSKDWAVRCIHEASLWSENCFLTLTYDDVHLPSDGSLHKDHFQGFLKRLRYYLDPLKIRFFACGEYGSLLNRPHYHAIIFNWFPADKMLFSISAGSPIYVSPLIQKVWPFGFHTVGNVTFDSAAYVARYILKKHTGKDADMYYDGLEPEFVLMSRRPGIAHDWILKYYGDVYPHDYVVISDKFKARPPKYYDDLYDKFCDGDLVYVKNKRIDGVSYPVFADLDRERRCIQVKIKKAEGKFKRRLEI